MVRTFILGLFTISSALFTLNPSAMAAPCDQIAIPPNPNLKIADGLAYLDTEPYKQQMLDAVTSAKAACAAHLSDPYRCLVLDVDDTLLDNREELKLQMPKQPTPVLTHWDDTLWDSWVEEARAPALKPVSELVQWAKANGFHIFLITARPASERHGTELNLTREHIPFDALFLKPDGSTQRSEDYKTEYRRMIEAQGYTIVCNIGDQESDLYGLHSGDCEKLPNRMYFTR